MKKNISINISGIIFHIEEDGYNDLKNYLESINKYFSTFEDNAEIIADIESRIAEIFLTKLDDHKQIIISDDVNSLIDTMGTIADFEAIEEDESHHIKEEEAKEEQSEHNTSSHKNKANEDPGKKRLLRDEKRKVVGGVASGLGHYFSIDPIWVRLIIVVLFMNFFFGPLSGAVFIAYIILWIVVPGSTMLGDDEHVKKMFRDSESRVLGGVASGIAAYFGIDVTVVRLLFVLSIFLGGSGFIIYIIFWIITPEAKSITEKMQMQGEPVTLSNIQQSVKKSLHNEEGEESPLAKVLLFPFRALAMIFQAMGKILGPFSKVIIDVLRVFSGVVLAFIGLSGMVALILTIGVFMGLFTGFSEYLVIMDYPISVIASSFSPFLYVAAFVIVFIPFFIFSILGLSVIAKRMVIKAPLGWSVLGLWIVSIVTTGVLVPATIASFAREGDYTETRILEVSEEPVILRVNYLKDQDRERKALRLRGHQDSTFNLVMNYSSQGKTRHEAMENAKMIVYEVAANGNEILFDSDFKFKKKAVFRAQSLEMTLFIPYGYEFKMEDDMVNILSNTISRSNYDTWQVEEENTWVFTEDGLECLTCPKPKAQLRDDEQSLKYYQSDDEEGTKVSERSMGKEMSFDMEDFTRIDFRGLFNVYITQSEDYEVRIQGDSKYREDVVVKKMGDLLEVGFNQKKWELLKSLSEDDERMNVYISLPVLTTLNSAGFCEINIDDFESQELKIDLTGGSTANLDVKTDELSINMNGGSRIELDGKSEYVNIEMSGASSLQGLGMRVKKMNLKASGVSNARVMVTEKLNVEAYGLSNIKYSGGPDIDILGQGGMSTIQPTP